MESGWIVSLTAPWYLCPDGSVRVTLGPGICAEVVVLPVLTSVLALLGDLLSPGGIWVWSAVA